MTSSQIIEAFERKKSDPFVSNWMFNFCQRKGGSKLKQRFVESHDYRYKTSNPFKEEEREDKTHHFLVECEHGWLSKKCIPDLILDYSRKPDIHIAIELESALLSIQSQCDLCRLK